MNHRTEYTPSPIPDPDLSALVIDLGLLGLRNEALEQRVSTLTHALTRALEAVDRLQHRVAVLEARQS